MNIGQAGIDLIKNYERCRLRAYLPTPDDVWTIGFGHCGPDVDETTLWTQERADAAFLADIAWVERCVNKAVTAQVNQNEFDAMCSLCFNIGCTAFSGSTLVKLLNAADYDGASQAFMSWNKQRSKTTGKLEPVTGLTRRRAEETALFDTA